MKSRGLFMMMCFFLFVFPATAGMTPSSRLMPLPSDRLGGPGFYILSFVPLKVAGDAACSVPRYLMKNPRFLKRQPVKCYARKSELEVQTSGFTGFTGYAVKDYVFWVGLSGRTKGRYSVYLAWLNSDGHLIGSFNGKEWVKKWTPVAAGKAHGRFRGAFAIPLIDGSVKLLGNSPVDYLFFGIKNDRDMWVYAAVYPVFRAEPTPDSICDNGYWVTPVDLNRLKPVPVIPYASRAYHKRYQHCWSVCYHGRERVPEIGRAYLLSSFGIPSPEELVTAQENCSVYKVCKGHGWRLSLKPRRPDGPDRGKDLADLAEKLRKVFSNSVRLLK